VLYLYYNAPVKIILDPPSKTSPAESLQSLCTQENAHRNPSLLKLRANKTPKPKSMATIRCVMPGFSPRSLPHAPTAPRRNIPARDNQGSTSLLRKKTNKIFFPSPCASHGHTSRRHPNPPARASPLAMPLIGHPLPIRAAAHPRPALRSPHLSAQYWQTTRPRDTMPFRSPPPCSIPRGDRARATRMR
jgi:hypothetical protein